MGKHFINKTNEESFMLVGFCISSTIAVRIHASDQAKHACKGPWVTMEDIPFCPLFPCVLCFTDITWSKRLTTLLLKSGPNLGSRKVFPYSTIKLLEVSFQPVRRRYLKSRCCCIKKADDEA